MLEHSCVCDLELKLRSNASNPVCSRSANVAPPNGDVCLKDKQQVWVSFCLSSGFCKCFQFLGLCPLLQTQRLQAESFVLSEI